MTHPKCLKHLKRVTLALAALGSSALWAATDTTTFSVTATVVNACEVSASDLSFGNYDPTSLLNTDATTTITVTCTLLAPYSIRLNDGLNGGGDVANRAMSDGTNTLSYNLYTDALRTTVWGNDAGTDIDLIGTGLAVPTIVYGRIPAQQGVAAASFTDTITVTVDF